MRIRRAMLLGLLLMTGPALRAGGNGLSDDDIAKIKKVHARYEETWLKGDADGVLALFTEDCVLLPPHADKPRIGTQGLKDFWFPPNSPKTTITKLVLTPEGIGGDGQLAYVWGAHEVAWTTEQDGKTTSASHKGRFLNVLRKQPDGNWKFSHHMWDDQIQRH